MIMPQTNGVQAPLIPIAIDRPACALIALDGATSDANHFCICTIQRSAYCAVGRPSGDCPVQVRLACLVVIDQLAANSLLACHAVLTRVVLLTRKPECVHLADSN